MISQYQGHFLYNSLTIRNWKSTSKGIYYCGYILPNGNLAPNYIGRAISIDGIRGRLLEHLNIEIWPDVTHFGYVVCSTIKEAEEFEATEIALFNPKYNIKGKIF